MQVGYLFAGLVNGNENRAEGRLIGACPSLLSGLGGLGGLGGLSGLSGLSG